MRQKQFDIRLCAARYGRAIEQIRRFGETWTWLHLEWAYYNALKGYE